MKENWVCPDVQVQRFVAQEFFAVCDRYYLSPVTATDIPNKNSIRCDFDHDGTYDSNEQHNVLWGTGSMTVTSYYRDQTNHLYYINTSYTSPNTYTTPRFTQFFPACTIVQYTNATKSSLYKAEKLSS